MSKPFVELEMKTTYQATSKTNSTRDARTSAFCRNSGVYGRFICSKMSIAKVVLRPERMRKETALDMNPMYKSSRLTMKGYGAVDGIKCRVEVTAAEWVVVVCAPSKSSRRQQTLACVEV